MNFVEKKSVKMFPGRQNPDPHYLAALERGRIPQEQLKRWRGGGITVAEVARLLRISPASVRKRWRAGMLVGWNEGRRIVLARWQFRGRKVLPAIEEVLRIFDSRDRWRVMLYFFAPRLSLRKKRSLDLLRRGETQIVLDHAKSHAEDNTW